jgi:hypothetical protein
MSKGVAVTFLMQHASLHCITPAARRCSKTLCCPCGVMQQRRQTQWDRRCTAGKKSTFF